MSEKERMEKTIAEITKRIRAGAALYLEAGVSPGQISAGLMTVIVELMKAQEMSDMQISNQLNWLVDEIREKTFNH